VLYRVDVPRFRDSDGDGVGDLDGLAEMLPYLIEVLSVDALWVSGLAPLDPPNQSPAGVGLGDPTGFDRLVSSAHLRGLRVIIDYVVDRPSAEPVSPPSSDPTDHGDAVWPSPLIQATMLRTLRHWLERGVDGVCIRLPKFEASSRPDDVNRRDVLRQLRRVVDEYGDRVAIGDSEQLPPAEGAPATSTDLDQFFVPTNRVLLDARSTAETVDTLLGQMERTFDAGSWTINLLGGSDRPRLPSRLGAARARMAAMLLLTMPGTPVLYYGDELGVTDMPETDGQLFTDLRRRQVEIQLRERTSMLALYRRLIDLRRVRIALRRGAVHRLAVDAPGCLLYARSSRDERTIIALNFEDHDQTVTLPVHGARLALSTAIESRPDPFLDRLELHGNEGVVLDRAPKSR
jgi:alpha-glucosidase